MHATGLRFSIASHAAWAPGISTPEQWREWAAKPVRIGSGPDPTLSAMPAMLRRRAGFLGKMALEVAYACLDGRTGVPAVFCSRHGEVTRAVDLLGELARDQPLSPTGFGLAVHNASAGLFSIARADRANHLALAGHSATIEHGVVEACGLLADGAPAVLLVAYDCPLPAPLDGFEDCDEQPYAWAWLMTAPDEAPLSLILEPAMVGEQAHEQAGGRASMPAGLQILRFQLGEGANLARVAGMQRWTWNRDA